MPTPREGYHLKSGERVPSVTTILGRFKDSGALMHWANKEGLAGRTMDESRDKAASIGTAAHALVEAYIKGQRPDANVFDKLDGGQIERAEGAFNSFLTWFVQNRLTVVQTEIRLVSERHRFGGTPDAIGQQENGAHCLLDWKTSNKTRYEYWLQLAAYMEVWDENKPETPLTGAHLIRFGKDDGDFTHSYRPRDKFALAWHQFLLYREAYENEKELKKWAA